MFDLCQAFQYYLRGKQSVSGNTENERTHTKSRVLPVHMDKTEKKGQVSPIAHKQLNSTRCVLFMQVYSLYPTSTELDNEKIVNFKISFLEKKPKPLTLPTELYLSRTGPLICLSTKPESLRSFEVLSDFTFL